MFHFSYVNIVALCAIAVSVCGEIPHQQTISSNRNVDVANGSQEVHQWLLNAFSFLRPTINEQINSDNNVDILSSEKKQESGNALKLTEEDQVLPILIHKSDELSGLKLSTTPLLENEKINPFLRTKRSTCQIPANLPQMVSDLNSRLNASQLVGLKPNQPYRNVTSANQPKVCPDNTTNNWWPRSEVNLRSTCPWNITELDLGENAFPRYINKAVCLCVPCIESPAFRCEEIKQTVTYFYRQGCQDGLALMNTKNITITVGCHCVAANPQTATANPGPPISR